MRTLVLNPNLHFNKLPRGFVGILNRGTVLFAVPRTALGKCGCSVSVHGPNECSSKENAVTTKIYKQSDIYKGLEESSEPRLG